MKNGYTLIEVMTTIVIIGLLATLAIPKLTGMQEPAKAGEAIQALNALHAAQLRYCLDHTCPPANYPVCADLDVDMPSTLKNFDLPPDCTDNKGNIGLTRTGGTYTLQVDSAGNFTCPACPANVVRVLPK